MPSNPGLQARGVAHVDGGVAGELDYGGPTADLLKGKDLAALLATLDAARAGEVALRPRRLRGH